VHGPKKPSDYSGGRVIRMTAVRAKPRHMNWAMNDDGRDGTGGDLSGQRKSR